MPLFLESYLRHFQKILCKPFACTYLTRLLPNTEISPPQIGMRGFLYSQEEPCSNLCLLATPEPRPPLPNNWQEWTASHLVWGTSSGLLPSLEKFSEWLEEEELEDLASSVPWTGSLSSGCCVRFHRTAWGDDAQFFLLRRHKVIYLMSNPSGGGNFIQMGLTLPLYQWRP